MTVTIELFITWWSSLERVINLHFFRWVHWKCSLKLIKSCPLLHNSSGVKGPFKSATDNLFIYISGWLIDWLIFEEFEEKCPPEDQLVSPRSVNVTETENLSYYSTIQVFIKVPLSLYGRFLYSMTGKVNFSLINIIK